MDVLIRQLPHDNDQLESQWPAIFDQFHKLSINISETDQPSFKIKSLDALTDYVAADNEQCANIKLTFIDVTLKTLSNGPLPSNDELVRIFCHLLDVPDTNKMLNLRLIEKVYYTYRLGERLCNDGCVDLMEKILLCLQKHEFSKKNCDVKVEEQWKYFLTRGMFSPISSDVNKLNKLETMMIMRSSYQQFYRNAAQNFHQSTIWLEISCIIERTFPTLFDMFTSPTDAQQHISAAIAPPVSPKYVSLLAKSLQQHPDLFKNDPSQIYVAIEKLVSHNLFKEAECFFSHVIAPHFDLITNLEELIQTFIRMCSSVVDLECRSSFCKHLVSPLSYELTKKKLNKKLGNSCFDLIVAIVDLTVIEAPSCAKRLLSISEFYPWKQLDQQLTHLIQSCSAYDQIIVSSTNSELDNLDGMLKLIHDRATTNPSMLRATHQPALEAVLKWSSPINIDNGQAYPKHVYTMGEPMTELVDEKQMTVDICRQLISILQKHVDSVDDDKYVVESHYEQFLRVLGKLLRRCLQPLKPFPTIMHEELARYCLSALNCPLHNESGLPTTEHYTALVIWFAMGPCIDNENDARAYERCVDRLFELIYDENEDSIHSWWTTFWIIVGLKFPTMAAEHSEQFLKEIIDHKQMMMIAILYTIYAKHPQPFHHRLNDLIHLLFDNNAQHLPTIASLLDIILKSHPHIITESQIDYLFTSIDIYHQPNTTQTICRLLSHVASTQPHLFDKHRQQLILLVSQQQQTFEAFTCLQQYLVASTIINGEQAADEYLTLLIDLIKNTKNISADLCSYIFHTCQLIGIRHKTILANKRDDLLEFESNSACRMLLDMIDGNKMSEEHQATLNRTLDEMSQIEERVVHTEKNVNNITKLVKRQELHMTNLDARVDVVDTNIIQLNEQVQSQARDIERIDAKTLSYVPSEWGHEACRLLNVRASNDWRLLGKRFGYSTSELKHWTMQLDPSMSLLNEWYMTHKADEATYGLVKMLNEIGRQDVEDIIRKAMATAGQLIPDDLDIDIKRLPPVFLSYQWGSQKAVTRLKSHLEQAGYACWMDTGEMGGGDKLFAKIDAGIRGAKVVVCCLNKKYAQSDNCSREVHLTISTGKPLIPLQMEKQTWPPEGALGPIMSEYLYIRFFDRKANDEDYWPADKFTELLGQIRYHVAPDPDMIGDQYRNWFVPRVDNLIFLQPTPSTAPPSTTITTTQSTKTEPATTTKTTTTKDEKKDKNDDDDDTLLVVTHPQVMISYQWDCQKEIVILYKKLTKLGYRCWLDIFQMGGGDSLFEKIDTGIRHAKCILSCVTPKYTKSINCRREMALSDALEKLIVPLLIEDTQTWPPAGPMSMVFAERSYIDFRHPSDGKERWSGKEFEMILARLKQAVPEVEPTQPRRHLLDMQRPKTSLRREEKMKVGEKRKLARIGSAPVIAQSRACSIM
ncbi:hypothetical protein I4U23_019432 [Adineta vaga]|nr:hypothetical protein I4U23_019432 [Adineta vaga]